MNKDALTPIELELKKLGLDEKEAQVYLACLELHNTSVQNIAKIVKLSRPTAYRVIESLRKKGLVKKVKQNKNSLIAAESPDEILGMLRSQKRRIEEQEREFIRIISTLKNKFYFDQKNEIKTFSGEEGIRFLLDDFSTTNSKRIMVVFSKNTSHQNSGLKDIYRSIRRRLGKIEIMELYENEFRELNSEYVKQKRLPEKLISLSGIVIISDKLIYLEKNKGIMIENEEVITLVKSLLGAIWKLSS